MAEHQGFMLLYTEMSGRGNAHVLQFLSPTEDHDKLWARARKHVGTHSDVDGCSTKPVESVRDGVHVIRRNTSFGPREASITMLPILRE